MTSFVFIHFQCNLICIPGDYSVRNSKHTVVLCRLALTLPLKTTSFSIICYLLYECVGSTVN